MSVDLLANYTITAPLGVDGYGEVAVLNDTISGNYVGNLEDLSFARVIRESKDDVVEGPGIVQGTNRSGELPFTMEIRLRPSTTWALSNARYEKLFAALNAMQADGSIVWTEQGRVATRLLFRTQQSPRGPDSEGKVLVACVSAEPRITSNTLYTSTAQSLGSTRVLANGGKAGYPPSVRIDGPITVVSNIGGFVIANQTASMTTGVSLVTTPATPYGHLTLSSGQYIIVDFANHSVKKTASGVTTDLSHFVHTDAAGSAWEAHYIRPGNNTFIVSGNGSGTWTASHRDAWMP